MLRLLIRDLLRDANWYKYLTKKDPNVRMFELYILSIINASTLTGYGIYKLLTDVNDVHWCKRTLASALGQSSK